MAYITNYIIDEWNIRRIGKELNGRLTDVWQNERKVDNLGCASYLYRKYGYPTSYQEFYDKYVNDSIMHSGENGRSEHWLYKVAKDLATSDRHKAPMEDYYAYVVLKVIIDTLDGMKAELKARKMLESSGFTCAEPTVSEDCSLGIDIKVSKNNKQLCAIQVKPISFFRGNNNESLIEDRKKAIEKEYKTQKLLKIPTYFFIYYKEDGSFKMTNGKLAHKLDNLITKDGIIIN